jgi:cytochrome c oxidase subunit 2
LTRAVPASVLLALLPGLALADPTSPLNPASPGAAAISSLLWFLLIVAGIIFVGVEGVIFYSVFRYRERPDRAGATFHGNPRLEIAWTAAPVILLAVIFFFTIRTMDAATSYGGSDPIEVNVVGHQWWWEFDYVQEKIVTSGELHVPVGETIILHAHSADVVHSFWMPQLAGKQDANPGFANTIVFTPTRTGTYDAICSELCGVQHAWMRALVVVQTAADYAAWVKQQQTSPPAPTGPAAQGAQIYQSEACGACHAPGVSGGPDLTHFGSRSIIGSGVLTNTPSNLATWLADPQAVKPGTKMPNFHLTSSQIQALVAYLESQR